MKPSILKTLSQMGIVNPSDLNSAWQGLTDIHDTVEEEYHSKLLIAAPHDLACYCEYMVPEEPPSAKLHQFFCEVLTRVECRELMRLVCSVPPGHAKSTYFSRLFATWYFGRNPFNKYIQAGHTTSFCENEFGKKNRNIISSERYQNVFPEVQLAKDTKAAGLWGLSNGKGQYLTRGIGQGIAGFRANLAAVDDPFASREDAESPTIRDKVYDWFMDDFTTRLLPNSPVMIVATRWHEDDLCGRLEQMTKDNVGMPYEIINLPALAEEDDPLGRPEGEPLWGEFYTKAHLLNLRATMAPRGWNSLYCGRPVDVGGGVLKSDYITRYDKLPNINEPDSGIRRVTISVDSAIKATERHDWTVLTVWIENSDGRHYLADVIRQRVEFNELVKLVDRVALHWRANAILVEDKGSGTQYIQVRGATSATPSGIPVIPISAQVQSKEFRFDAITPMFSQGLVLLPKNAHWLPAYEREILTFPTGTFDDQVDSTSQYLEWARRGVRLGSKKMRIDW